MNNTTPEKKSVDDNTPDTEWEKKIQELKSLFIELEIGLSIQETAKIALCIREVESLLTSRDTYWKERVRVLVSKNTGEDEFDVVEFLNELNNLK